MTLRLRTMQLMLVLTMAWMPTSLRATEPGGEGDGAGAAEPKAHAIPRLAELRIDEYVIPARAINLPIPGKARTVQDLLDQFGKWARDETIGAVLMDVSFVPLSLADIQELRGGIAQVQSKGKKVYAFLDGGGPTSYLLASAANEIVTPPSGSVVIPGIGSVFPFMKGYFQRIGLEYDVITAGKYKYPGFLNRREPNEFFKEEFGAILDSWFEDYKLMIASRSGMSTERAGEAVDRALFNAADALQWGLVDNLAYYNDYRDQLLRRNKFKRLRRRGRGLAQVNSLQDLMGLINEELQKAEEARHAVGPKIAVVHARGPIVDFNLGAAFASRLICRDDFIKVIEEVRRNDSIKAVVMRVDSPGGSGFASDMIWERLRELAREKPLVVSMGRVAGSGGYYISCPARRIFAQPTTLTGSIGVLGIFQSAWSQLNRADYELREMKRGKRALLGAAHRTLVPEDRALIQEYITKFYEVFVDRVATTRKLPAEQVRKIAEGRIYSGRQALKLGLVDELGGLAEAIASARHMAGIPASAEIRIVHYPRPSSLGEILESFSALGATTSVESAVRLLNAPGSIPFDAQVSLFAGQAGPLCWMAMPPVWKNVGVPAVPAAVRAWVEPMLTSVTPSLP